MFQKWSIKYKLAGMITLVSFIILGLGFGIIFAADLYLVKESLLQSASVQASLIAEYCVTPMAFNDAEGAGDILDKVSLTPLIESAYAYDSQGKLFAVCNSKDDKHLSILNESFDFKSIVSGGKIYLRYPIKYGGELYGRLDLVADMSPLKNRAKSMMTILLLIMLFLLLVAYSVSLWCQKFLSDPILRLVSVIKKYKDQDVFELQTVKRSDDEIGILYQNFAEMFTILEKRKKERNDAIRHVQKEERRFRSIIETSNEGFFQVNSRNVVIGVNPELCKILKINKEAILGTVATEFVQDYDRENVDRALSMIRSGQSASFELTLPVGDDVNDHIHCLVNASPFYDEKNEMQGGFGLISDITERKHAEEALRESENKFRSYTETTSSAIFMIQDNSFVYMNKAGKEMSGYSLEELQNKSFWSIVDEEYREKVRKLGIARQRGQVVPSRYEFKIVTPHKGVRWVDFTATSIVSKGRFAILGTAFDITERKLMEERLARLLEMECLIASVSSRFINVTGEDIDEEISQALATLGHGLANLKQISIYKLEDENTGFEKTQTWSDHSPEVIFEPKKISDELTQTLVKSISENKITRFLPGQSFDGVTIPEDSLYVILPLVSKDVSFGFMGALLKRGYYTEEDEYIPTFRTIAEIFVSAWLRKVAESALKSSEKRYRTLIEMMNEGFSVQDDKGLLTYVNQRFCDMLGYTRDEFIGNPPEFYTKKDSLPPDLDISNALATLDGKSLEVELIAKDGTIVPVIASPRAIVEDGEVKGYFAVVTDVTTLKQTEDELRRLKDNLENEVDKKTSQLVRAQEKLIQAERLAAMGQLGGTVAHEFRNQLGVMRNVAFFLKLKLKDSDSKILKHLKILEDEIIQTDKIIENILMFARSKEPDCKVILIKDLLDESIEKAVSKKSGCSNYTLEIDDDVEIIEGDYLQLLQVFVNLIGNAFEATSIDDGIVKIHVTKEADFAVFQIADNGCGMSDEVIKRIFEPLFTTKARGAGLGLPTVKILIERHNGVLEIDSSEGVGTSVIVRLPLTHTNEG